MTPVIGGARWDIHATPDASKALIAAMGSYPPADQQGEIRIDVWTACTPLAGEPHTTLSHRVGPYIAHVTPNGAHLYNTDAAEGWLMLPKTGDRKGHVGTNVLFPFISWWARSRGLVPLHAAALGVDGRYWLIPAASGSGKSVACVLGQAEGLQSLGDDVVLWDPASNTVHAINQTVRVTPAGLRLVAGHLERAGLRHQDYGSDGKALLVAEHPWPRVGSLAGILLIGERDATQAAAHRQMLSTLPMMIWSGVDPRPVCEALAHLARSARLRSVTRSTDPDDWAHTLARVCRD